MGATIVSRTVSSVTDKRAALSNAQIARALPFGTSWNKIRIGFRYSVTDSGGNLTVPILSVGVCSGTTNMIADATTTNWVGFRSGVRDFARYTSPTHYRVGYSSGGPNFPATTRVGTTITQGIGYNTDWNSSAQPSDYRWVCIAEIEKGSPNYTLAVLLNSGSPPTAADVSLPTFLGAMQASTPTIAQHYWQTNCVVAASEVAGSFDTLNIAWNQTTSVLEISDLAIAKMS